MDHANAYIMDYTAGIIHDSIISSKFSHQEKIDTIEKSEKMMHHKEQHEQAEYYKQIGAVIRNYDEVILFGDTNAKAELYNTIKKDHLFEKIRIDIENTDKMTENDRHAFVTEHFIHA